jgi:hypothetical protein
VLPAFSRLAQQGHGVPGIISTAQQNNQRRIYHSALMALWNILLGFQQTAAWADLEYR